MRERKIIELLRKLNKKELKQLSKFLISPYHNTNKRLVALYTDLLRYAPLFDHPKLSVEALHKAVFGIRYEDEKAIPRLLSQLHKKVEEFIVVERGRTQTVNSNLELLRFYRERRLGKNFQQKLRETEKHHSTTVFKSDEFYFCQFLIEAEISHFASLEDDRIGDINLQNEVYAFLRYSTSRQLIQYCHMKSRQQSVNIDYDFESLEKTLDVADSSVFYEVPLIQYYKNAGRLLQNPTHDTYKHFKNMVVNGEEQFPQEILRHFYTILENSAVRIFSNRNDLYKELFSLYEPQISSGVLYSDGILLPQILKNIITVSLRLKKYRWAEKYLSDNKDRIESEDVYNWNLARIHFANRAYSKTLDLLEAARIDDMFYVLETKRLLLRSYYELEYDDLFFSFLNAFRVFLSRKGIGEDWKKGNQEFLNFAFKLASLGKYDHAKMKKLKENLADRNNVLDKTWLLEKIEERL